LTFLSNDLGWPCALAFSNPMVIKNCTRKFHTSTPKPRQQQT
jgi:hypothetical protein